MRNQCVVLINYEISFDILIINNNKSTYEVLQYFVALFQSTYIINDLLHIYVSFLLKVIIMNFFWQKFEN